MSIKASNWVGLIQKRKAIFAQLKTPACMQDIADITNYPYATVNNHIIYLLKAGMVKFEGRAKFGDKTRDVYVAIVDEYNPDMPAYVSQYISEQNSEAEKANNKSPHVMRVSSDDYHTRGFTPKRSSWVASSLQGF